MTRTHIPAMLRAQVAEDAQHRCGYCLTPQAFTAMPLHIEHIIPLAAGGSSERENLWLACPLCNGRKATRVAGIDPQTSEDVPLYNPRRQPWDDHFTWSEDGIQILGLTPTGRATVGWHPPAQDR